MRTFIAIEIPEEVKEQIIEIQKRLPSFKGKLTEKENLHITLKFLGEINENKIEEVKKRLREIKYQAFDSQLENLGFFDNPNKGIVLIHLTNCEILQKEIDERLKDLFFKEKRFMSHLTIARTKQIKDKQVFLNELNKIKISPLSFKINEFNLKESIPMKDKHVYRNLENYKLI